MMLGDSEQRRAGQGVVASAVDRLLSARWRRLLTPVLLGAATSLSQAPLSLWPIALIGPALALLLALRAASARRALETGWLFGFGYFFPGLMWIGSAFQVEAEKFAWMEPFALTILPAGLALFWAPVFWATRRAAGTSTVAAAALGAGLWALSETLRGYVLTGFPWGMFAFSWIETPAAQTAAWIGPYGLNALMLFASANLAAALLTSGRRAIALAVSAVAIPALLTLAGLSRLPAEPPEQGPATLRLVQPNVPQKEKWVAEFRQRNFDRLIQLSTLPSETPITYVVWPESAVPFWVDRETELRGQIMAAMPEGARLILGAQRFERAAGEDANDPRKARYYNSLFLIGGGGAIEAVYDKHHLVPFGEFLPFQDWLQSMGIYQLAGRSTGFSTGPGPLRIAPDGAPSFAPLICYEAIFPQEMPSLESRPALLLQITNDAWFGDSSGPWQHLVQARFRAIEQGLPLVRAANTGISASVDPYGRVTRSLGIDKLGSIDVRPAAALAPTFYAGTGDWPSVLGMLAIVALGTWFARSATRKA